MEKMEEWRYRFYREQMVIKEDAHEEEFSFFWVTARWRDINRRWMPGAVLKDIKKAEAAAKRKTAADPNSNYYFGYITTTSADAAFNLRGSKIVGNYLFEKYRCRGAVLLVREDVFSDRLARIEPRQISEQN